MRNHTFYFKFNVQKIISHGLILLCLSWAFRTSIQANQPLREQPIKVTFSKPIRRFLHPIHFNFSLGYGHSQYSNKPVNLYVLFIDNAYYLYTPSERQGAYLIRWYGKNYVYTKLYEDLSTIVSSFPPKEKSLLFTGRNNFLPLRFSMHMEFLKRFRIELGTDLYLNFIKKLTSDSDREEVKNLILQDGMHYTVKINLTSGFKLFENDIFAILLNTQLGMNFYYGNPLYDSQAAYNFMLPFPVGLGLTFEKHISEYASLFARLLYEQSSKVQLFSNSNNNLLIMEAKEISLCLGISLNCPEIPRCKLPKCKIRQKHTHAHKPYRGASLFTGKNYQGYTLYKK